MSPLPSLLLLLIMIIAIILYALLSPEARSSQRLASKDTQVLSMVLELPFLV